MTWVPLFYRDTRAQRTVLTFRSIQNFKTVSMFPRVPNNLGHKGPVNVLFRTVRKFYNVITILGWQQISGCWDKELGGTELIVWVSVQSFAPKLSTLPDDKHTGSKVGISPISSQRPPFSMTYIYWKQIWECYPYFTRGICWLQKTMLVSF